MKAYKPARYNGKTMMITQYVILDTQPCTEESYDRFALEPDPPVRELLQNGIDTSDYEVFDDLDRELYNSFRYRRDTLDKKIYLYTEIHSKTKTKIIINISSEKGKLWINGKCVSLHPEAGLSTYYVTVELHKGLNYLLLEQVCDHPDSRFFIQIRNYRFEAGDDFRALSQVRHTIQRDPLILVHDPLYCPSEPTFRFMYFCNDESLYKKDFDVQVVDNVVGQVPGLQGRLNEVIRVNTKELRALHDETLRHVWLGSQLTERGERKSFCIYIGDFKEKVPGIIDYIERAAREQPAKTADYIMGKMQRLYEARRNQNYATVYWMLKSCQNLVTQIQEQSFDHDFYKRPGIHELFIRSRLDDSFVRLVIRVPKAYDPQKALPAFMALATSNVGSTCWKMPLDKDIGEPYLCFDITGRGYSGGSYFGEASILELLQWIKENFRVDEERLYFLGYSNGGFATYALAQNHPSLPAAIYPHTGYPQIETVKNTANIPTYQLVSSRDYVFEGKRNEVKNRLEIYNNYHQYYFKEMSHSSLAPYLTHKKLIKTLLKHKRNAFPDMVEYKTCRNRHLESYWVKLHGIARGKQFGQIKAVVTDAATIRITAAGIRGVTITLPPKINKEAFDIILNNKVFSFRQYEKNDVIFIKAKTWVLADREEPADPCKGTGLLDVYMDALRILLPEAAGEPMKEAAERFAHPFTNGYYPKAFVDYPVYSELKVPDHIFDYNLIVFDQGYGNAYAKRFRERLPVRYDASGYEYQGVYYEGEYVVMQVIPNPYNRRMSLLVISTNHEPLLKQHILLRKVVVPTYMNGLHKYWNNEILVFNGKIYSAAYEQQAPLQPVRMVQTPAGHE